MIDVFRPLRHEPRVADAPGPQPRDWWLLGAAGLVAIAEAVFRTDLVWPLPSLLVCLAGISVLPWRRRQPLAVLLGVFGIIDVVAVVARFADADWDGLYTTALLLLLPYSLVRWGSGRDISIAVPFIAVGAVATVLLNGDPIGDAIGGVLVLLLACTIGAVVRSEHKSRGRMLAQLKSQEREEIARELHDTVAHHVSAIAIQAQAGLTLAARDREAAVDALRVIEDEASRTLGEMRAMVGALRRGNEPELAPQPGVADISSLGAGAGPDLEIDIRLLGVVDDLHPAIDTAVYRIAQESLTNVVRHARQATRVQVEVVAADDHVRVSVIDDGRATSAGTATGFGLVGMRERAQLLGGTLDAGPIRTGGWSVVAVLPRDERRA